MTLEQWLSKIYAEDIKNDRTAAVADFQTALTNDDALRAEAQARLNELDALVNARGEGACAFSTKYRVFLQEAFT